MTDFREREPVPSFGEKSVDGGTDDFHNRVLTVARDNIKRAEFWSRRGFELTQEVEKLVKAGKVAPLSDEDCLTLVRWIDLGCPIDLDYDPANPKSTGYGWMLDDQRPTLTLQSPRSSLNPPLERIRIGMYDYRGLDASSLEVIADFAINGVAAGENLASKFQSTGDGIWELKLTEPLQMARGVLKVSVKDRQGNMTRIERTFSTTK